LDIVVALLALIVFGPLMVMIWLIVRLSSDGPGIYAHPRIGLNGREFRCLKFRSMVRNSNERLAELLASDPQARLEWEQTHKLRNDPRITPIGWFLRKSSLDELPQLFNVLKGEMSLVGPRPVIAAEIERYGAHALDYIRTRPGLTGLWQVSGRSDTSYAARVALDVAYVRLWSLGRDVEIILKTVPAVLLQKGSA